MEKCIRSWLNAYKKRGFIRYSIIDKNTNRAIGTSEIFGGAFGVLRIDVRHEYENEAALSELLKTADLFFDDFDTKKFITKAIPEAEARINALVKNGYVPCTVKYEHYFMKRSPNNGASYSPL